MLSKAQSILDLPPPAPGPRLTCGDDRNQFGELRLPSSPKQATLCGALEYRRIGQSGGGYPGTLDDIRAGAKRLTKIPNVDLSRVAVAGHSAGGHLALWLAAQNTIDLRSVAGLAAVSDLRSKQWPEILHHIKPASYPKR